MSISFTADLVAKIIFRKTDCFYIITHFTDSSWLKLNFCMYINRFFVLYYVIVSVICQCDLYIQYIIDMWPRGLNENGRINLKPHIFFVRRFYFNSSVGSLQEYIPTAHGVYERNNNISGPNWTKSETDRHWWCSDCDRFAIKYVDFLCCLKGFSLRKIYYVKCISLEKKLSVTLRPSYKKAD